MSCVIVNLSLAVEDCSIDILAMCVNICSNYAEITKGFVLVGASDQRIGFLVHFCKLMYCCVGSGCWRRLDVAFWENGGNFTRRFQDNIRERGDGDGSEV